MITPGLASVLQRRNINDSKNYCSAHSDEALVVRSEQRRRLSITELQGLIGSCIPESCDNCIWLETKERLSCPCSEAAPCRKNLNEFFGFLESKGLM